MAGRRGIRRRAAKKRWTEPTLLVWLVAAAPLAAVPPIVQDKRIEATVTRTLSAPDAQPMRMPTDVAVGKSGRVYVTDGVNDRIVCFTAEGKLDRVIGEVGGQRLRRPIGLTVDARGRLWIADAGRHRLVVLGEDPAKAELIDLRPAADGHAIDPTDVAVTQDGKRTYIVDNDNHRLIIRDNGNGALTYLGRQGSAVGEFRWPFMIGLAPDGTVHVSEAIGARVQRITPDDRWAGQAPVRDAWGVAVGQVYRPKGVAVDARGSVYVSDSTMGTVQAFTDRGALRGVLTDSQGAPLRFQHPMGMAFDGGGRLYVVELLANRVAVVTLKNGKEAAP